MLENEIMLNGVVIGKVFDSMDGSHEVWIPHGLVMEALKLPSGMLKFTHDRVD